VVIGSGPEGCRVWFVVGDEFAQQNLVVPQRCHTNHRATLWPDGSPDASRALDCCCGSDGMSLLATDSGKFGERGDCRRVDAVGECSRFLMSPGVS